MELEIGKWFEFGKYLCALNLIKQNGLKFSNFQQEQLMGKGLFSCCLVDRQCWKVPEQFIWIMSREALSIISSKTTVKSSIICGAVPIRYDLRDESSVIHSGSHQQ